MQKNERNKKLLIIMATLCLFVTSYYYYIHRQQVSEKPARKIALSDVKPAFKGEIAVTEQIKKGITPEIQVSKDVSDKANKAEDNKKLPENVKKQEKEEILGEKEEFAGIKPTTKADLIRLASNMAGKKDPFSYRESNYTPPGSLCGGRDCSVSGGLPEPPEQKPDNYVEIKGFFGNKVIAEVSGFTDSLSVGETLRGIKVLSIDSGNFTCDFDVNGERVTRKMKPLTQPDKNVKIKHLNQASNLINSQITESQKTKMQLTQ